MIPLIIHYCWFGGKPLPEDAKKCIESWRKFCPGYAIVEWNESNFDLNSCKYVAQAYDAKKWAFVSDYVRLYALIKYGGVYMDTDVEIKKPLNEFMTLSAFSGFESDVGAITGIMACEKNHPFFKELISEYDGLSFVDKSGNYDLTTNVTRITNKCLLHGLKLNNTMQTIQGFTIYPKEYFCPINPISGRVEITNNTYAIHWFSGSWKSAGERAASEKAKEIMKRFPGKLGCIFAFLYESSQKILHTLKYEGAKALYFRVKRYVENHKYKSIKGKR